MLLGLHRPVPLLNNRSSCHRLRLLTCCTMAEGNYNDRWLKIWADGLKPGEVGADPFCVILFTAMSITKILHRACLSRRMRCCRGAS